MNTQKVVGKVGKFNIGFRKEQLTSHAGTVLLHDFAQRLGVARLLDEELRVKVRERGYGEGQAIGGLVYNLILGGEHLSDLEVLRGDPGTQELLEAETILAPTTAGEFLRKFDIGDVHDLQRVQGRLQQQVRPHQQAITCTIDLDSSIYEQASSSKEGSTKAYNGEVGYHPVFAFWAEEGELLFSHLWRGSAHTARNVRWFLRETHKRLPATAVTKLRADSDFYSKAVVEWCEAEGFTFTITADQTAPLLAAITALPERRWRNLPEYDLAEVADLHYQPTGWAHPYRYVVKRELAETKTGELYWKYHATVTNEEGAPAGQMVVWHLQHAAMENAIKEHKSGFGLEKLPTQKFHANWAYLLIGQLAFNLVAWFKHLVLPAPYHQTTIKTIRHHLLNLAGKIVHTARRCFLICDSRQRLKSIRPKGYEQSCQNDSVPEVLMLIQEKINAPDTLLKLYVAIDEDLKVLQPQLRAKSLPRDPRGGPPTLSAAEVLTIVVWGAWRGLKDKATLYFYLRTYHHREFPALGAYSKFVDATNRYSMELRALLALMLHRNRHAQGAYPIVLQDSTALAVCHVARARQHRTFRAWACKSKNGMGWWYGFKLHVQCDEAGRLCGFDLTTATVDDRKLLEPFTRWMQNGIVVGDGG